SKGENVGESWEISAVEGSESVVADGEEAGMPIGMLVDRYRGHLVGKAVYEKYGNEFPLLVKFIDARLDLSIQVHPDDELSQLRHGKRGKTEMWYVIDNHGGSHLVSGIKRKISPAEYARAVEDHTIAGLLCDYEVHPGDVFFLPAGRIHSIGAGTFLAEIQETSDITYRIYDFNRRDSSGKLRELHTELAADAIDYTVQPDYRTDYERLQDVLTPIADCRHFSVRLLDLTRRHEIDMSDTDKFVVVMVVDGNVSVAADDDKRDCRRGETILVAAAASKLVIDTESQAKVLLATV
ncbi:MAG: mannose-6-phosphate isomerase, partial [Duncaniella sp.]|nr:mannose-6-phosphate isomerase [Duncaniella sp.]